MPLALESRASLRVCRVAETYQPIGASEPETAVVPAQHGVEAVALARACQCRQRHGVQRGTTLRHRDAVVGAQPDVTVVVVQYRPDYIAGERMWVARIVHNVFQPRPAVVDVQAVVSARQQTAVGIQGERLHRVAPEASDERGSAVTQVGVLQQATFHAYPDTATLLVFQQHVDKPVALAAPRGQNHRFVARSVALRQSATAVVGAHIEPSVRSRQQGVDRAVGQPGADVGQFARIRAIGVQPV